MEEASSRDHKSRRRSMSPRKGRTSRDEHSHRDRSSYHRSRGDVSKAVVLPFRQQPLDKRDLKLYQALFADYLDVQKGLDIAKLPETEIKGRWKSFIGKWNRRELAEGWYDPETLLRAKTRPKSEQGLTFSRSNRRSATDASQDEVEDDDLGPRLPATISRGYGPAVANLQDLQYRRELDQEDRANQSLQYQQERKMQRKTDKERLEDLVPRAEPGSRERQLEKKRDVAQSNKAFADAREAGTVEIADNDLMGEDGIDAYKAKMRAQERQKNEREIRKEEVLRARAAEREERLAEHRRKEEKTMQTLRALAQQRYGNA